VTHGSWVTWVMGQELNGSLGSWVTLSDPFPALFRTAVRMQVGDQPEDRSGPVF